MDYDFSGLTRAQQWILTYQGYVEGSTLLPRPQRRTVQPLIERGLLEQKVHPEFGTYWEVPIAVHRAWCEHCANLPTVHPYVSARPDFA